jgi:pantothenate kinase
MSASPHNGNGDKKLISLPKGGRAAWFGAAGSSFASANVAAGEAASGSAPGPASGSNKTFIVGVCGGTAAGKTTVCKRIVEALGVRWVLIISMDNFYKGFDLPEGQSVAGYNFDHPDAFDLELLGETLQKLR